MKISDRKMLLSPLWLQTAIITFLLGFAVLGYLALRVSTDHPPIPRQVLTADGSILFTGEDIISGQQIFQKYGLMQYGTIYGHGAYLGPDFTAQYLHYQSTGMLSFYRGQELSDAEARERIRRELKANLYDPNTGTLKYTKGQDQAFGTMVDFYRDWLITTGNNTGLRRPSITNEGEIRKLTAFFSWAAWTSAATRPDAPYSYTNNWPADSLAGNEPTAQALLWSVLSLAALLGGTGVVLFLFGRYKWLGWHGDEEQLPERRFILPDQVRLTPAQRATAWYFLVVAGLFLCQGLLGGVNAHYHVEPEGFFGLKLDQWLPYNLSRMWHVQLALFFVASSFLAMGIFLAPMIARHEPRHQDKLALVLFGALVVVVVGSLAGEAASIKDYIGLAGPWFWIGSQGWEYLDLGRLWQMLLTLGMFLWLVILVRGLKDTLQEEHPGNMPWLFLYSALSIPLFYAVGMAFGKSSNFAVIDFWRFWVVHLWVEDFLELFTTIMVAYIFVLLGVVRARVANIIIYMDIILYSIGGVIGTMHHLYFSGAPAIHMALGAFFSAMEVIPLVLLTYEAWRFMQLGVAGGEKSMFATPSSQFPHKWAVMFLIAVGFWNFLGAGVFGFLINLPIVSYYEIGTQWTANHGHGALMGVYGMLAMRSSFWSMNIGLAWMLFINLFPVGVLQLNDALTYSYWHARAPEFFQQPLVRVFEWLRFPGDAIFIVGGIFPVVYLAVRMFINRNRPGGHGWQEEGEFTRFAGGENLKA
ncbi:nitric-oxide reductase large subunit [Geotalea toluenoxydans]